MTSEFYPVVSTNVSPYIISNGSVDSTGAKKEYERCRLRAEEHAKKVMPAQEIIRRFNLSGAGKSPLPSELRSFGSHKKTPIKTGGLFTPQMRGKSTRMEKKARNQKRQQRGG